MCVSCGYEHPPQTIYRGLCQRELYAGSIDAALKISRKEGFSALWNGVTPTLAMIVPSAVMYFTMFDKLKEVGREKVSARYHPFVPSLAGITARCLNISVFSPIELVRTKAQSEHMLDYRKLKSAIRGHIATNGVRSLWYGAKSQLLRDLPFTVVYWFLQDAVKVKLAEAGYNTIPSNFGGAIAGGAVATVISHPFDLTKTQLQSSVGTGSEIGNKGLFQHILKIKRTQGFRGLYVGLTPRMVKVLPSCAIFITSFEGFKEYFNARNAQK